MRVVRNDSVNLSANDRVADLERQVRELTERIGQGPVPLTKDPMCQRCREAIERGGFAVCGCISHSQIICAAT